MRTLSWITRKEREGLNDILIWELDVNVMFAVSLRSSPLHLPRRHRPHHRLCPPASSSTAPLSLTTRRPPFLSTSSRPPSLHYHHLTASSSENPTYNPSLQNRFLHFNLGLFRLLIILGLLSNSGLLSHNFCLST